MNRPTKSTPGPTATQPGAGLSRRRCLGALLASGAVGWPGRLAADEGSESPADSLVVDTHLHCFAGANDERFPYHQRAPYRPIESATPQHLLACMHGAGVDNAIVVHPEPYQDDHRYLEHCLDIGEGRLKGTCLFFADSPGSLRRMREFLRRNEGRIVAARIHAYAPDRLPPFGKPEMRQLWKTAADHGIAVQIHLEPRYAERMDRYVREFASVDVIIDHLGRPMQGTPEEHAIVMQWSELPKTVMKLSALPDQGKYPHRDVAPIIKAITEAWGCERLIYGGGFGAGATPQSYRAYRETLTSFLSHLSADDQAKVLGENAARMFGFG